MVIANWSSSTDRLGAWWYFTLHLHRFSEAGFGGSWWTLRSALFYLSQTPDQTQVMSFITPSCPSQIQYQYTCTISRCSEVHLDGLHMAQGTWSNCSSHHSAPTHRWVFISLLCVAFSTWTVIMSCTNYNVIASNIIFKNIYFSCNSAFQIRQDRSTVAYYYYASIRHFTFWRYKQACYHTCP